MSDPRDPSESPPKPHAEGPQEGTTDDGREKTGPWSPPRPPHQPVGSYPAVGSAPRVPPPPASAPSRKPKPGSTDRHGIVPPAPVSGTASEPSPELPPTERETELAGEPAGPRAQRTGTFAAVGAPAARSGSSESTTRGSVTGAFAEIKKELQERTAAHPTVRTPTVEPGTQDASKTGFFKPLPTHRRLWVLWQELGLILGQRMAYAVRDDHVYLLLMAAIVGITAGLAAGLLLMWIDTAAGLFRQAESLQLGFLFIALVPTLGGLCVGTLSYLVTRSGGKIPMGIPEVIDAVGHGGGKLEGPRAAWLGLGTGLTIASGGSLGHEGPTVAIGATVGSAMARFFGLRMRRQVAMIGAGCAAGLAAAFNAPLAGVIFTVEVVFRRSVGGKVGTMSVFVPLIVAAVAGTFTSHAIFGARTEFEGLEMAYGGAPVLELVFYLLVAVSCSLLSPLLTRAILFAEDTFTKLPFPSWLKPAVGGLGVGLLGIALPQVLGSGRLTVAVALQNELLWTMALALLGAKLVATSLSRGSGGMGGIFMPSLFMGASVGVLVHALAVLVLGDRASGAAAYALVGMGAYLGATLRAPLTPIVMIFELTHEYGLILPLMFACILSAYVAGRVEPENLYELRLRRGGIQAPTGHDEAFDKGRVGDLMDRPDHMLRMESSFDEVQRATLVEHASTLYFVDAEERVAGFIDSRDIAAKALRNEIPERATAGELAATQAPTLLYADDSLAGAMLAFARSKREVLPVVDGERRIVGLLERNDLMTHYSDTVLDQERHAVQIDAGTAGPDQEVGLGDGIVLERMTVRRAWAGRTLAQLELRKRASVQVLEWRRGHELMLIDPHKPLREGDVLALAGQREGLLKVRWLD